MQGYCVTAYYHTCKDCACHIRRNPRVINKTNNNKTLLLCIHKTIECFTFYILTLSINVKKITKLNKKLVD